MGNSKSKSKHGGTEAPASTGKQPSTSKPGAKVDLQYQYDIPERDFVKVEAPPREIVERTCNHRFNQETIFQLYQDDTRVLKVISPKAKNIAVLAVGVKLGKVAEKDPNALYTAAVKATLGTLEDLPNEVVVRVLFYLPLCDVVHRVSLASLGLRQHVFAEDTALPYFYGLLSSSYGTMMLKKWKLSRSGSDALQEDEDAFVNLDGVDEVERENLETLQDLIVGPRDYLQSAWSCYLLDKHRDDMTQLTTCTPPVKVRDPGFMAEGDSEADCIMADEIGKNVSKNNEVVCCSFSVFSALRSSRAEMGSKLRSQVKEIDEKIKRIEAEAKEKSDVAKKKHSDKRIQLRVSGGGVGLLLCWILTITGVEQFVVGTAISIWAHILGLYGSACCSDIDSYSDIFGHSLLYSAIAAFVFYRLRPNTGMPRNSKIKHRHVQTGIFFVLVLYSQCICPSFGWSLGRADEGGMVAGAVLSCLEFLVNVVLVPAKAMVFAPIYAFWWTIFQLYKLVANLLFYATGIGMCISYLLENNRTKQGVGSPYKEARELGDIRSECSKQTELLRERKRDLERQQRFSGGRAEVKPAVQNKASCVIS